MSDPVYLTAEEIQYLNEIATTLNYEFSVDKPLSVSVTIYDLNGENLGRFEYSPSSSQYVFFPHDKSTQYHVGSDA